MKNVNAKQGEEERQCLTSPCGKSPACFIFELTSKNRAIQCTETGTWHVRKVLQPKCSALQFGLKQLTWRQTVLESHNMQPVRTDRKSQSHSLQKRQLRHKKHMNKQCSQVKRAAAKQKAQYCQSHPYRSGEKARLKTQYWSLRLDNGKAKIVLDLAAWEHPQTFASTAANTSLVLAQEKNCDLQRSCSLLSFC